MVYARLDPVVEIIYEYSQQSVKQVFINYYEIRKKLSFHFCVEMMLSNQIIYIEDSSISNSNILASIFICFIKLNEVE